MRFVSDDQRKAVFARLRGGGPVQSGIHFPWWVFNNPYITNRGQTTTGGTTSPYYPTVREYGTLKAPLTRKVHSGGLPPSSPTGQLIGIAGLLAGAEIGGPFGAMLIGAGLLGRYTLPMLPGWGQKPAFFNIGGRAKPGEFGHLFSDIFGNSLKKPKIQFFEYSTTAKVKWTDFLSPKNWAIAGKAFANSLASTEGSDSDYNYDYDAPGPSTQHYFPDHP